MIGFETVLYLIGALIPLIAFVRRKGGSLFKKIRNAFKDGKITKEEFEGIMEESGIFLRFLFKAYSEVDEKL
ncbi:hypothetical protein LCGC14_0742300 [marine sediment metagenome]|uniref:EF-hand domain-containing protein n=1 Tax=marine sediment metagenome TaxID=412755 RepID=A0A0F9QRD2_9ZZZZ